MLDPDGEEDRQRVGVGEREKVFVDVTVVVGQRVTVGDGEKEGTEEEVEVEASKSKKKKIAKRNVLLWENFIETDDKNIVLCNINPSCKARIRRPDGSTSGMRSHFETRHHLQYAEYVEKATASLKEKVIFQYEFYLNTDESE